MGKKGKSRHKGGQEGRGGQGGHPGEAARRGDGPGRGPVDATQVATRLSGAALHLLRRQQRADAAVGQSGIRLSALGVLVLGGPRTLGQLADAEGVTAPSMTRLVSAMEADGLVERSRSTTDGRLVIVTATPAGEALLGRGGERRVAELADLVAGLPAADQRHLEAAVGILEDLLRPAHRP